jgi:LysM repeat protein
MKKFPIMEKIREFRCSLGRKKSAPPPRRVTRLHATARRASAMDDYEDDQPTTKLSSAFIVVLILHIVAVGGIFAFKGIKAHRLSREVPVASAVSAAAVAPRPSAGDTATGSHAAVAAEVTPITLPQKIYRAHGGEALAKVAAQQGVSLTELAQHNGLNPATVLKPNQSVVIPSPKTAKPASQATPNKTAIAASATPAPVSQAQRREAFLTANQQDTQLLKTTAQKPAAAATPASAKQGAKTYTVAKNDTVTSIAKRHGVSTESLMKLNKIEDPKKLQLNQTLQIPAKKSE